MERWWKIVLLISIICGLAACKPPEVEVTAVPPTRTLAPTMTMTGTAVPPSPTPAHTATPLPTVRPTETSTAVPTQTATAVPTVTPPMGQVIALPETEAAGEVRLEVVNQMGGAVTAVAVQDNLAYLGIGSRLAVADVSDPTQPRVISWSGILPGIAEQIILRENLAYIALGEAGLWVFDISNPLVLKPVGHVQTTNPARHFLLSNNLAYIVNQGGQPSGDQVLSVVDLTDPAQPAEISTLPIPVQVNNMTMVGDYLYVSLYRDANFEDTLLIIDVADPVLPVLVTAVPGLGGRNIASNDNHLFTSDPWGRLIVSDISDPLRPVIIIEDYELISYGGVIDLYLNQDVLWVVNPQGDVDGCGGSVIAFDVSQPENMQEIGGLGLDCIYNDIVVNDGLIYLATNSKLHIADATSPSVGTYRSELFTIPPLHQLAIGDDLYGSGAIGNHHNVYPFSLKNPTHPQMGEVYNSEYSINDIAIAGSQLYLATYWQGIVAIDISDPSNPLETAHNLEQYWAENSYNLVFSNDRLYASLNGNLGIFDSVTLQSIGGDGEELYGRYNSFVVGNNILWTWGWTDEIYGLQALDVTNPEKIESRGFLPEETTSSNLELLVDQGFVFIIAGINCINDAYLTCEENSLKIIDARNPSQMTLLTHIQIAGDIGGLAKSGDTLLLFGNDLWLVDVANPALPNILGQFATPGYARDAVMQDGLIYVADGAGGLLVLRPLP